MISLYRNKFDFKTHNNASTRKRLVSSGLMIGLVTLALFSPGIVNAIARFDHVTRYIELEDTNMECNFAVWNDFNLPSDQYQLGSTRDLDLTSLSPENNRTLIALGKMNTTFYTQENLNSPSAINRTIAYLKLLDLYNITVMQTIWYSSEIDENFPKPYYPEDWIKNARTALEKIIEYNITNIIGICADSEGSAERLSAEEYFQNIEMYEDFLKEVQTNSSLAHPSPYQDTFQTVLTIEPRYLQDRLDGVDDTDIMDFRRMWGGMEWTDYHFMLYRTSLDASPTEMYNYLTHIKNTIGVERGAPICGITGVRWFAEGFFAGTAQDFKGGQPDFTLDGVDGWEGMKREILFSKAMGFHTVSLFKLHANDDPLKVEGYGLNETYGLEAIEDLAEVWNQPKIIKYPLNYMKIEYGQRGLYPANHEFRYDLFLNPEVAVFQGIILIAVVICIFFKAKRRNIQS